MTSVRITSDRIRALLSQNTTSLEEHVVKIGQLQNSLAQEEQMLKECLLQRQRLESL